MNSSDCNQKVQIMIMWGDHSIESGHSATDVLEQVCGGWNPPTVPELRRVLAKRCGLTHPTASETDLKFLHRLADAKVILLYEVDENEWA
jgi:hypothetical protein